MILTREKIIYLLVFLNPVWEVLYSILYRMNINVPINQAFRLLTFGIFLCFVKRKKTLQKVAGFGAMYLCIWIIQICAGFSKLQFSEITFIFKIIYSTSLIYIFIDFIQCETVNVRKLIKVTIYSTFIIIFSVCISPLGLGYESWLSTEYRTGYTGWFLFGNYLTVVLLIAISLLVIAPKLKHRGVWGFFMAVTLLLLGNKAGLIGFGVYAIGFWIFYVYSTKLTRRKGLLIIASIGAGIIAAPFCVNFIVEFVNNQIALYKQWGFTNLVSFLLSNRDWHLYYVDKYIEGRGYSKVLGMLIGYGYNTVTMVLQNTTSARAIEMDIHALGYYLGIFPVLVWLKIYIKATVHSARLFFRKKNLKNAAMLMGILLVIFHSLMAGHVIFESLAIMYFAILAAIALKADQTGIN